nr:AMP-binding protein [Rhodococcus sp. HNM0569]
MIEAWTRRVEREPERVAITYFDATLSAREVDRLTDALAVALARRGVTHGDRVGIYLQNIPQYPLTLLALWKLGAAAVPVNPMYRGDELARLLTDSGAVGVVSSYDAAEDVRAVAASGVWVVTTDPHSFQTTDDPRVFTGIGRAEEDELLSEAAQCDGQAPAAELSGDDLAILAYTSGTTGPPKGACNSHANVLAVASSYAAHVGLTSDDVVLGVAPLFHITGAVVNATMALLHGGSLVLAGRFHPEVTLDEIRTHGVTFTIGSITVFNALGAVPQAGRDDLASIRALYSGGAPIPPATVERFEARFGHYIHNVYGMTETTSAVVAVPLGERAPVDAATDTLSVGKALPGLTARVVDASGADVSTGAPGELELSGPQVVSGYLDNPEATASTFPGGRLRTGDVAVIDADGWVYLVDRIKDQINVSGFKVWPREVEDALYRHPSVHEAGVVGVPDDYQGESVVAFVSLGTDAPRVGEDALLEFVREHLAAYKRPKHIHVVDDLPKTQTGKIRRTALREVAHPTT